VAGRDRADALELAGLTAAEVTGFVLAACRACGRGTAKLTVTGLRSLLSWLHVTGEIGGSLAWAVPAGNRRTGPAAPRLQTSAQLSPGGDQLSVIN
jgi:integrase/recombinase XerD